MRAMVVLAAAAATIAVARAQESPDRQRPTFRTGANIVRVDATIVDRRGNPVTDLTADDFVVFEDGVPQRIQSFKFVGATGFPAEGDELSLAIRSPEHAAAEAARDDVRVFLIFWDEYHIGARLSALRGREALQELVLTGFGPTDLVALMDPLTPLDAIRFTRDRRALAEAIRRLQGRRGIYTPTRSAAEDEHLAQSRSVEAIRAQVTASAIEGAAIHLGTLREGRKAIILVSETLGLLGADVSVVMPSLTRAANANNTAIFTMDPRGLGPVPSGLLQVLSDSTGGRAIVNTNDPMGALRQVVRQASAYYLLGYASSANPTDGRFHEIRVKLRRADLQVQARRGYWAPNTADVNRARAEAAAAAPPEVATALGTLARSSKDRRLFEMWTGTSRRNDGQPEVTVAWLPRPDPQGTNTPRRATLTATGGDGRKYYDGEIPGRHVRFAAPAGGLRIQIAALDAQDLVVDRETRRLQVPDYAAAPLAVSEPVVVRIASPREQRTLLNDPGAAPFVGREFVRADRVLVRFSVYGPSGHAEQVAAQLMSRSGARLVALSVQPLGDGYQVDLPLSSVARGEYVISIEVVCGKDHAQALVPLRVLQ